MTATPAVAGALYAEDLAPGWRVTLGSHAVSEAEIISFATQWDPQYFHVDPARAETDSRYGGLIASGLHTVGIFQRLWVDALTDPWQVIAGDRLSDVRFLRPVRPGDVLSGYKEVSELRLEPEKQRGCVTCNGVLSNQDGKQVMTLTMSAYLEMRPS